MILRSSGTTPYYLTSHYATLTPHNLTHTILFHITLSHTTSPHSNYTTPHPPHSATEDFNNAIVLTNRCLMPGEVFQVRLDKLINKWTGSVEIGVTTHRSLSSSLILSSSSFLLLCCHYRQFDHCS